MPSREHAFYLERPVLLFVGKCVGGNDKHIARKILGQTCKRIQWHMSHLNQWESFHHLLWVLHKTELAEKTNKMKRWGAWGFWKACWGGRNSSEMLQMTIDTKKWVLPLQRTGMAQGAWEGRQEPEGAEGKLSKPMLGLINQRGQTSWMVSDDSGA